MSTTNERALKLHMACVKAGFECPQFAHHSHYLIEPYYLRTGYWLKSYDETLNFWAKQSVLWHSGYAKFLPDWALKEFDDYCGRIGHRAFSICL